MDEWKDIIFDHVSEKADAYISKINPGNLPTGEKVYFETLKKLSDLGVVGMPHPDAMSNFGAKDALTKFTDTGLVPKDTYAYYTLESFKEQFPGALSLGERVLKHNRRTTGTGIWRVFIADEREYAIGEALPLDYKLKCTEAVDNHVEHRTLGDFMGFCEQYIVCDNG